ncbi:glycosyltransferase family 4 protein [Riemerella anatipestifer]|uniref:glycosyltransferase family 4 protein n=1 Tax=Riemerella anatipestifer TaxID=34085 RepID=UPI001374FB12|nr:glycosyltransferase family 4 protein [Riemerella anatipestifer]
MKKVLLITQNYIPSKGGMANSCKRIVRNLRKSGVTVHVLHFINRKYNFEIRTEINGNYASLAIYPSEEYTLNLAQTFLESHISNFSFDIVMAFGGYLPLMWSPIVAQYFEKPLYTCIRGNDFDEFIFSKRRNVLFYALENSAKVFSVTQEKCRKIEKIFPKVEVCYTPNGINVDEWKLHSLEKESLENFSSNGGKKIITITGQLKPKKGTLQFLENFENFKNKNNYEVRLVGDIPKEIEDKLSELSFDVKSYPFVSSMEMKLLYHSSDIICIPSFYDGMPNVLLEAAACGKLVIASNVGGIPDIIEDSISGILFNPLVKNSLIDAFFRYEELVMSGEIEAIQKNLHEKIKNLYREEDEINNYIKHLK